MQSLDNILIFKFNNRSICFNINHNKVKSIIQNIQFVILWVCKTLTTQWVKHPLNLKGT